MEKKLYRDQQHKVIGGVCAGLAEYFDIDVSIVRVLFIAAVVLKGSGVLIYCIMMIVLPKKNYIFNDPTVDYKVPPDPMGYKVNDPFVTQRRSNGNMIAGTILIGLGLIFLLNQLDIIPYINFHLTWPIVLIAGGLLVMFSSKKKQPWKDSDWKDTPKQDAPKTDEPLNDNPPTE